MNEGYSQVLDVNLDEKAFNPKTADHAGFGLRLGAFIIDWFIVIIPAQIVGILAPWLYHSLMNSNKWQATVGKRAVGTIVVNRYGQPLTFGNATGRYFAKLISAFTLGIGYLMVLWTEDKQALHDKIAGTYVIKGKRD